MQFLLFFSFLDEAATVLRKHETVSGSKYTLRIYHSLYPLSKTGAVVDEEGAKQVQCNLQVRLALHQAGRRTELLAGCH